MADPIYLPSREDVARLRGLTRRAHDHPNNTSSRPRLARRDEESPELYVARAMQGIPARSGLIPGQGQCLVYQLVLTDDRDPMGGFISVLQPVTGLTRTVYNLEFMSITPGGTLPVARDKFGKWYAICAPCVYTITDITGTGTEPTTGTGTGPFTGTGTFDDIHPWGCCSQPEPVTGTGTGTEDEETPIVIDWPSALQLTITAIRPGSCSEIPGYEDRDLSCVVGAVIPLTFSSVANAVCDIGTTTAGCYAGGFRVTSAVNPSFVDYRPLGPFVDCIHLVTGTIDSGQSDAGTVGDTFVCVSMCCTFNLLGPSTFTQLFFSSDLFWGAYGSARVDWYNHDGVESIGGDPLPFGQVTPTVLYNFCQTFSVRPVHKTFTLRFYLAVGNCTWADVDFLLSEP